MALGTYNRTRANRQAGTLKYDYKCDMLGSMTAGMGAGTSVHIRIDMAAEIEADMPMRHGYDAGYQAEGGMQAQMRTWMMLVWRQGMTGEMTVRAERLLNDPISMRQGVDATAAAYIQVRAAGELYGDLRADWNSLQVRDTVMRFENIDIPPGGILVIDSEYFTATLNGVNIIDQYAGDWIEFTRKLKSLEATGISSGALDVSVLYRERYL